MTAPLRGLTDERRRALDMLASSPHGCTESILRAHGFTISVLAGLMRTGLAKAEAEFMRAGGTVIGVVRISITDAGRQSLAR
jgi:hypothetical protein